MITANLIHRTFRIKCGNSTGTGFAIDVDGRQYLVTAKHVVKNFENDNILEVFGNGIWSSVPATLVGHCSEGIDVTVIAPKVPMSPPNLPVMASSNGLIYGQDVFFLGFPYGVLSEIIFGKAGYPLPLVKKALISSIAGDVYLLDGHNNPGFSGAPVVFGNGNDNPNCIAGIISGYRFNPEPIYDGNIETGLNFRENTGIIISFKIETALELIQNNPIGPLL